MEDWKSAFTEKEYDAIVLGTGFKVLFRVKSVYLSQSLQDRANLLCFCIVGMSSEWYSCS